MGRNRLTGGLNFDERRIWQVGVSLPINEFNVVKEASGDSSISKTIATQMMARLNGSETPPLTWVSKEKPTDCGRHTIMVRLNKSEYDRFIEYCDARGETMSDCVRRLIFGFLG